MLDDNTFYTVTDLKQFSYCERVIFYEHCLPHIRPRTFKMDAGRDTHETEQKRALRRTLAQYDIPTGKREFDVPLQSTTLMLRGILDELITGANGEIVPIDYKLAKKVSLNHHMQLAAYAMLLEETRHTIVQRGFVYLIPLRRASAIPITDRLREQVRTMLSALDGMVTQERMPAPTRNHNHCTACEFRRFCNDV